MRRTVREPLPILILAISAVATLTSCSSSVRTAASPVPTKGLTHLAVADSGDNRIVIYGLPLAANASAGVAIGQPSLTQGSPNQGATSPSANTLYSPEGIAIDSEGGLWVADSDNCRVLEFLPPFSTNMSASRVIGQPDFQSSGLRSGEHCSPNTTLSPSRVESPVSVAIDSDGDLWVADDAAGRILEYVPPFSNGMAASLAIGQPSLESAYPCNGADFSTVIHGPPLAPTAATLCDPEGIAFDARGDLWVADLLNGRVLEFRPPFSTGMSASIVLGKSIATYFDPFGACAVSASTMCGPKSLDFDAAGNLWVSSPFDNRVVEFVPPFSTGMAASVEIGQPNFVNQGPYPAEIMNGPEGLAFDTQGNLLISDEGSSILIYTPPVGNATSPATVVSSGLGSCPVPGPGADTLCFPAGVAVF